MGFREGAYATVWEVRPGGDTWTKGRISVSRKTEDGKYDSDFEDYVMFCGTSAAVKALQLKPKDRIRLLRIDATTSYDREKNMKYHNYKIFEFENADKGAQGRAVAPASLIDRAVELIDGGEVDNSDLPF